MAPQRGHLARFPAWLSPHWILCPLGQRNSITSKSFARAETKRKGSLAEKVSASPPQFYLNPRQRPVQQAHEGISARRTAKPRSSQKQRQPPVGPRRHCRISETAHRACRGCFAVQIGWMLIGCAERRIVANIDLAPNASCFGRCSTPGFCEVNRRAGRSRPTTSYCCFALVSPDANGGLRSR